MTNNERFCGVILAAGQGTRLRPYTNIINKFLLPIYNKVLIEHSIYSLKEAGITDIAIVLGKKSAGETIDYLQDGQRYEVNFTYLYQNESIGVANALYKAKDFVKDREVVVLCADNILHSNLNNFLEKYHGGCIITTKEFNDLNEVKKYAVLEYNNEHKVTDIHEKPSEPMSNTVFAGIQVYDKKVWKYIEDLKPSNRGEYEITDVIRKYINNDDFNDILLDDEWFDCGDSDSLLKAQVYEYIRNGNSLDKLIDNKK